MIFSKIPFTSSAPVPSETVAAAPPAPPTERVTVVNMNYEPPALYHTLSADKLMRILRSAEHGDTRDYFALLRDVIISDGLIQTMFATRKLAVLGDVLSINPPNKDNADDVKLAELSRKMVEDYDAQTPEGAEFEQLTPWLNALAAQMDGHLLPVSVTEKVWKPSTKPGLRFELKSLVPVPHHLLDYTTGQMMICDVDENGAPVGSRHAVDPDRYIVHRGHLLSTADTWGGPMRSTLVWCLLMNMDRTWWARFLERFGAGFMVGKYEDDDGRRVLQRAFSAAVKIGGLVISKETEVELMQAAAQQSGDAFKVFREVGRKEIAQIILGQSGTVEGTPGKLGGETAQESVRQDFRQWDAIALSRTLKGQLFAQFKRINGLPGEVPRVAFGSETVEEKTVTGALLQGLKNAGLELTDDGISRMSEKIGLPLQRSAAAAPAAGQAPAMFSPALFTAGLAVLDQQGIDATAKQKAGNLAAAFRGSLNPLRDLVLNSASRVEALERVETFCAGMDPRKAAALTEVALALLAARGAAAQAQK